MLAEVRKGRPRTVQAEGFQTTRDIES
jgi:hypothetical protein